MARPSNTAERRSQISEALIRVMSRHGYHAASVAKIAAEAGLAPGLVHYHFETKGEILIVAVRGLVAKLMDRYEQRRAAAGGDPERELDAFIDAHLALGDDASPETVAAWVVIGAQAVQNEEVRRLYAESVGERLKELERLVRALRIARGQSARGSRKMAAAILSAIEGCYLLASGAPGTLPEGYAAPTVRSMVRGLLS